MTTTTKPRKSRAAAPADSDDDAGDTAAAAELDTLDGVVIAPELQFVTPKKDRPQTEDERFPFSIDGHTYTIVAPAKLEETLAPLIAAGARAADESDVLFAGANFLRRVLAPESLIAINQRLEDPRDDFELADLYDNLQRIAAVLIKRRAAKQRQAPANGPVPARRRAR